jgi:hypothetical protein
MAKPSYQKSLDRLVKELGEEIKRLQIDLNEKVELYNKLTEVPIEVLKPARKDGRRRKRGPMSAEGRARIAAAAKARWKKAKAAGKSHL